MTKYTVNLPERLNVWSMVPETLALAQGSRNPQGVFDASESIFHAGIDALAIAVILCETPTLDRHASQRLIESA